MPIPNPELKKIGVKGIFRQLERLIRSLPEEPILMGHSQERCFTQILLDRGLGVAGVALNPAPTTGVALGRTPSGRLSPCSARGEAGPGDAHMSRKFFATRFAQTIPAGKSDAPMTLHLPAGRQGLLGRHLDQDRQDHLDHPSRAPLLLIGGEIDLIADASMTRPNTKSSGRHRARPELRIFPGRSH